MLTLTMITALAGELDEKLLGDEPVVEAAETADPAGLEGWGLVLGAIALGGITLVARRKMQGRVPAAWRLDDCGIEVIARKNLGAGSGLAIVEVEDGSGGLRRLLVGVGSRGPSLVSDLSSMADVDAAWDELGQDAAPKAASPTPLPDAVLPRDRESVAAAEVDRLLARKASSRRPWADAPEPKANPSSGKSPDEQRADKARDLVQQVLRARNGQWTA